MCVCVNTCNERSKGLHSTARKNKMYVYVEQSMWNFFFSQILESYNVGSIFYKVVL